MEKISVKNQRSSNLELLRILSMLLIVIHHYIVNSGLMSVDGYVATNPWCIKSLVYIFLSAWGKVAINCFMMITGYFMCTSEISYKKLIRLIIEVLFYSITLDLIFLISGYEHFSFKFFIKFIIRHFDLSDSFTPNFLFFYLLIPYLNILIKNMDRELHKKIILLLLFGYTIMGSCPYIRVSFSYASWYCVIYLVASYFRIYNPFFTTNKKILYYGLLLTFIASNLSIIISVKVGMKFNKFEPHYFLNINRFFGFIISVFIFLNFLNMKIQFHKWINVFGGATFGVLCIHGNSDTMRRFLWTDLFHNVEMYKSKYWFIHLILVCLGVYLVCSVIEIIRKKTIEKWFVEKYSLL